MHGISVDGSNTLVGEKKKRTTTQWGQQTAVLGLAQPKCPQIGPRKKFRIYAQLSRIKKKIYKEPL